MSYECWCVTMGYEFCIAWSEPFAEGALSRKNLSLRGRAGQKVSKPSKIFGATLMRCAAYWQDPPASLVILSLSHSFSQTFPLWAQIMTQWQQCTVDQKVPTVILHQAWAPKPGTCPPGSPWCRRWRPGAPRRGWFQAVEAPVDFMTTLAETRALVAWRYISSHIF